MASPKEIKKAKQMLSLQRMEKGLSLKGLYRSTPPYYKNTGRDDVVIKKYNPNAKTKGKHYAITAVCKSRAPGSRAHKCSIVGMDKSDNMIYKQKRIKVSCDCEDFCFTWEYALFTWGAATIKFSNGEPAVIRNPGNVAGVCKHLAAVMALVLQERH